MDIKITFQGMPHSDPMEAFVNEKAAKITSLLKNDETMSPLRCEIFLEAHKTHPHNRVSLHLKTPRFDLDTHYENEDMYFAIEHTVDKMVTLLKKEKSKWQDKSKRAGNEKTKFYKS